MNLTGIIIGICTFLIIGILHPVIIKTEYHFGTKAWPVFLALGLVCIILSLFLDNVGAASLLSVLGFSLLWGIRELFEQKQRVAKGWFPKKEKKK